ncbi:MAG: molybdopterin-binding protein [Thermomicrobiales bacterium]
MQAYILSIGSELIEGHITDTNATFLAQELGSLGIELVHVVQCGDNLQRLANVVRMAVNDADLVICTGGIGPTGDDLTREAIAEVAGETPAIDDDLLVTLTSYFRGRGMDMPERNKKQAWLIPSATSFPNPVGTAPGWLVEIGQAIVIAMPGVPREMFKMWKEQAVPRILQRSSTAVIKGCRIKTLGIGESAAEQELGDLVAQSNPVVATYAKDDGVHVHVTARAATEDEAAAILDRGKGAVYTVLGQYVYGEDDTELDSAILALARQKGVRLAITDAGGGRFDSLLAAHPKAWDVLTDAVFVRPDERTASELAMELAAPDVLSIGISVTWEQGDGRQITGTIDVATAGATELTISAPFRGVLPELQRRSGMVAADLTLRALRQLPDRA